MRGVGLAWGVDLPDARGVRDRMRELGVLVGTTGRRSQTLKIRPPLAFDERHVPVLMSALESSV